MSAPCRLLARLALLNAVLLGSCSRGDTIVVGAKAFDEGYVLGHIAVEALRRAGYDAEEQFGVASAAMRKGLETGQIDLYYEYTGTAYTVYAGGEDRGTMVDSARVLQAVRAHDSVTNGLIWLRPMPFNNTYALLMRRADATKRGIASLSALRDAVADGVALTVAVDAEFHERPDGLKAMLEHYGFPEVGVVKMDAGLIYTALEKGEIDVGMGYSTDGRIPALDLVVLEDDRNFFPAYNPAAVVREDLLKREPRIRDILEALNRHLTPETIRRLNAEVSMNHRDPRKVAKEWMGSTQN